MSLERMLGEIRERTEYAETPMCEDIPRLLKCIEKLREQRDWWLGECCERYGGEDMNKYIEQDDAKLLAILNGEAK